MCIGYLSNKAELNELIMHISKIAFLVTMATAQQSLDSGTTDGYQYREENIGFHCGMEFFS